MTTMHAEKVKCGVCGKLVKEYVYDSLHIGDSISMDGFSDEYPEPTVCLHCGYISYDISKPAPELLELVNSPKYKECKFVHVEDDEKKSDNKNGYKAYLRESNRKHIRKWYQYFLIMQGCNDLEGAYYALRNMLHYLDDKDYQACLPDAYDFFLAVFDPKNEKNYIVKLDYLRRLKRFDEAIDMYYSVNWSCFSLETVKAIVWEKQLIDAQDNRLYSYGDFEYSKYKSKIEFWNAVISFKTDEAEAYKERADLHFEHNEYKLAEEDYSKAISLQPDDKDLYKARGDFYARIDRAEDALEDYDRTIRLDRYPYHSCITKAELLMGMHCFNSALDEFINVGKDDSDLKKIEECCRKGIEYYESELAIDSGNIDALIEKSRLCRKFIDYLLQVKHYSLRDYKDIVNISIDDVSKLMHMSDHDFELYWYRGMLYHEINKQDLALKDCNQAIVIAPYKVEVYILRGKIHEWLKEYELAAADYTKAIEIDPENIEAINLRLTLYWYRLKRLDLALEDYKLQIKLEPDKASNYSDRARLYEELGMFEKSIEDFSMAITLEPNELSYYRCRARVYKKQGEYEMALHDYNTVIKLEGGFYSDDYITRAEVYEKLGLNKLARKDYKQAVCQMSNIYGDCTSLNKFDGLELIQRSICYKKLGKHEKANADLELARTLCNDFEKDNEDVKNGFYLEDYLE